MLIEILTFIGGIFAGSLGSLATILISKHKTNKKLNEYKTTFKAIQILADKKMIQPPDVCSYVKEMVEKELKESE
jgi:uncharacterized membrane protein YsdA (DUF1294 family)